MQYLVQLRLASSSRPTTSQEGMTFIEQFIFPTLERCKELQDKNKILAGGPVSGAVALVLIVSVESAQELDELITSLPIWPRMETTVTPLTTFNDRMQALGARLEMLKGQTGSNVSEGGT